MLGSYMMFTDSLVFYSPIYNVFTCQLFVSSLHRLIEPMVQEMIVMPSAEVIQQFSEAEGKHLNVKGEVIQTCGERIIENMIRNFLKSLVNEFLPS